MHQRIIQDEEGERYINICPHCGNNSLQRLICKYMGCEEVYTADGDEAVINLQYQLVECSTCEKIILYCKPDYETGFFGEVLFPPQREVSIVVPAKVKKAYDDAIKIVKISPNAFAVQIRRALEFLCKDKEADGRNLSEMVHNMAAQGLIPPVLAEMTNGLRILGNYGAHASDIEFNAEDATLMDDFFKAIIEYVYVAPQKIELFRKRLAEIKMG